LSDNYFHILIDLKSGPLQKDMTEILSSLNFPNVCISFHASPGKGFFKPIPCNMLIFNEDTAVYGLEHYRKKQKALYPDASFIYIGKKFYFNVNLEVLEVPENRHMKYLSRCFMNLYVEFNRIRINGLLKDSLGASKPP
jgi:hypothetical protein